MPDRTWPDPWRTVGPWDDPPEGDDPRTGGIRPEREPPPHPGRRWGVDDLVRLGTDHAPSLVAEGGDRVLGPFAVDAGPAALRHAVALAAFLRPEDDDATPVERALRELRGDDAQGLRCARWAPLAPWRVRADGDRAEVEPLLPMGTGAPTGPVAWGLVPTVGDRGGDVVFARLAPDREGWALIAGLAVPAPPLDWLFREAQVLPAGRPPTTEGTLRRRGHLLLRRWLEHVWATTTTIRTPTR